MSKTPGKGEKDDNNVISLFSKKRELSNKFNAAAKDYFKENTTFKGGVGEHYVPPPPSAGDNGTLPDDSTLNQEYRRKQDEAKKKRESNNRDVARLYNLHKGPSSPRDKK